MQSTHLRWSFASTLMTAAMQLLAAATLTRFLQPGDFGLASLALLSTNLAAYLTQLGVGRALVQKPHVTPANVRAAFTLALGTGAAGTALLSAASPWLAHILNNGHLLPLLRVYSLNLVFQACSLVSGSLLRRALRMRALALCDAASYAISTFCLGLPLAIKGSGAWALVISTVSQSFLQGLFYFAVQPHSPRLSLRSSAYEGILSFSGKASLTTLIEAVGSSADSALIGRLLGTGALGLYSRSLTLSTQPCFQCSMGMTRVFAPTLRQTMQQQDAGSVVVQVADAQRQLLSFILPFCTCAAVCAPTLIALLFGPGWLAAVPVYRALCLVAALDSSFDIPALQLEIAGQFRKKIAVQSVCALTLSAAICIIAPRHGLPGVVIFYAGLQFVRSICFHYISAQSLLVSPVVLLASWAPGIACSIFAGFIAWWLQTAWIVHSPGTLLLKASVILLATFSGFTLFYFLVARDTVYLGWMRIFRRNSNPPAPARTILHEQNAQRRSVCV